MEYRIVKETREKTGGVSYYIERKRFFLKWIWWSKIEVLSPNGKVSLVLDFDSYEKANHYLNLITEGVKREIFNN